MIKLSITIKQIDNLFKNLETGESELFFNQVAEDYR